MNANANGSMGNDRRPRRGSGVALAVVTGLLLGLSSAVGAAEAEAGAPAEPTPIRSETGPAAAKPAVTSSAETDGILLNFKDASLGDVLNHLSEAAGFVIVQEAEVSGTVTVTSHQPINRDEAVDLLNSVLVDKGYAAIRNNRILRIVKRSEAQRQDLPVRSGSDPEEIPRKDEIITQIIPVRYVDAAKLIENIKPLLAENAALTANESSNAILLTDTQTNIRRIAEIIQALDTSISSISTIKVFALEYADATEVASVITEVFSPNPSSQRNTGRGAGIQRFLDQQFQFGQGGGAGGAGGRGGAGSTGSSLAQQAASRVVAVADEFTNSLVVSAPDEMMPTIEQIVAQLDTNIADITEVKVFRLEYADATELAAVINELYVDTQTTQGSGRGGGGFAGPGGGFGGPGGFARRTTGSSQRSQRALLQSRVMAVGDPRTNSLIVSAARETMMTVAEMVGRLDASSDKKQKVFVMPLEHADVENVADILRGMFEDGSSTSRRTTSTGSRNTTSRLNQRTTTGADTDTTLNTGRGAGGGAAR